ncbi:unnamed protein product [Vitrella brassicaformis CCMP3155]|uniref:Uncharacterized protein n=1 Tax=Vitrella brassicaformis (strain CCMP3155) TaxID=1169540 RepID=A0A0G4EDR4_VITBC|nr:unnamed protein product [Vitrella brassicaformis CCMP3155]|eukprot:CEL93866.1 unnamed protein product [Vitrella brassicaformis CCMP3155]
MEQWIWLSLVCLWLIHAWPIGAHQCFSEYSLAWCVDEQCYEFRLNAAAFQAKIKAFYATHTHGTHATTQTSPPPIRGAFFLLRIPPDFRSQFVAECPGLIVFAHLLAAEALLLTEPLDVVAGVYAEGLRLLREREVSVEHQDVLVRVWPLREAVERVERLIDERRSKGQRSASVSVVVCHCMEGLEWLASHAMDFTRWPVESHIYLRPSSAPIPISPTEPPPANLATYGLNTTLLSDLRQHVASLTVIPLSDGTVRGDECTAYLTHINSVLGGGEGERDGGGMFPLSDYLVMLQGDAPNHLRVALLASVLAAMQQGTWEVPFFHLNTHRHLETVTPCMESTFEVLFDKPPDKDKILSTYCCAQFVVSRERLTQRPPSFYRHMATMVDGSIRDTCVEKGLPDRSSHCFVFEFLWHLVMGEDYHLPPRPLDNRLPPLLRIELGDEHHPSHFLKPMTGIVV